MGYRNGAQKIFRPLEKSVNFHGVPACVREVSIFLVVLYA